MATDFNIAVSERFLAPARAVSATTRSRRNTRCMAPRRRSSWQGVTPAGSAGAASADEHEEDASESTADGLTATQRAVWQAKYNAARDNLARVIVPGWRRRTVCCGGSTNWSQSVPVAGHGTADRGRELSAQRASPPAHGTDDRAGRRLPGRLPARCASAAATTTTHTRAGPARTGIVYIPQKLRLHSLCERTDGASAQPLQEMK